MALDPEVRRTFEAAGERIIRASLNRRHPDVSEWLQEREAARARKKRRKRKIIRTSVAAFFVVVAGASVLTVILAAPGPLPQSGDAVMPHAEIPVSPAVF